MFKKIKYVIVIGLLIITSCGKDEVVLSEESENANSELLSSIENEILKLVNEHRASINKDALKVNSVATKLAKEHTDYMIKNNKISHDYFQDRFDELAANVSARTAGENVASHYNTAKKVVNAWLNSQGHKENIEGNFTHIGIAATKDSNGKYYFTQIFYR